MRVVIIILVIIVFIALCLFTNMFRMFKSIVLILQVTPYEQTVQGAKTILVIGDSTGYGTGAGESNLSIAGLMGSEYPNYTIENNSKNGRTIFEAQEVLSSLSKEVQYELILLQVGANDILRRSNSEEVRLELIKLYTEANKHSENVVMLSNGNIGASYAFKGKVAEDYTAQTRVFRDMYMETAKEYGVHYVDLFVEPDEDVFVREPKKYTAFDGLHPTADGYAVWYTKLQVVLEKILIKG